MSEWRKARLAEVAKVGAGNSAPQNKALFVDGAYPFFRTADVGRVKVGELDTAQDHLNEQGIKGLKLHRAGTVLIPKSGASTFLDHRVIITVDGYVSSHLATLWAEEGVLDRRFLYWVMQTIVAREVSPDTSYPTLSLGQIGDIEIPLPPLEEQGRIVAMLDEAFAAIATATANAEKNLANARELSAMFPNADIEECGRFSIGGLLERGWLTGHMDGNHGGDYPRKDEFVDAGVTYLSANCIRDGLVDFGRAKFLTRERAGKLRKGFAKNRDVLFAHNATVGPVALLQTDADFVVLGTSLTYYRCNEEFILPEYLASFLRSPAFVEQYSAVMRQSTRNQVPITKQREFFVDVPPIATQRHLVASLSGFQEEGRAMGQIYQAKLGALAALKQSLLRRAFSGELSEREPLAA